MTFFRDRSTTIAIVVFTVLTIFSVYGLPEQSVFEQLASIVFGAIGIAISVYFLKFLTDGTKSNRKSPYNDISFSAWSYIWRIAIILWLFPLVLLPLIYAVPQSMLPVVGTLWFIVANNFLIFLLFCRKKKQKVAELKVILSGLSI